MSTKRLPFKLTLLFSLLSTCSYATDYSESHPLISAYEGATVWNHKSDDFFNASFPVSAVPSDLEKGEYLEASGKAYFYQYNTPDDASMGTVVTNYQHEITKAGFVEIFSCKGNGCGPGMNALFSTTEKTSKLWHQYGGNDPVMLYRLAHDKSPVYLFLAFKTTLGGPKVYQTVLEQKTIDLGKVKVNSEYLEKQISLNGRVVLEGLYFEHGSATLKTESTEALKAIAEYIHSTNTNSYYVVGHTDDTGSESHNVTLSSRRSENVVKELVSKHSIDKNRLLPRGAGPWVPKVRDGSTESKTLNRRVELVLKLTK